MIASSALAPLTVCVGALVTACSIRVLRMPPSFGNLHVAAMLIGVGLVLQSIWPYANIEITHLVSPVHLGWLWVQVIMPLSLFANAFAIRSIRRIHLKPFIGTFAICGTILIPAGIAGIVRVVSYWAGDNLLWLSCAMFGTIVAIPDPRASRDFANYVSSDGELGGGIGLESCLIACVAVSIFTALQTFSGVQALPARIAITEGASIVSGLALGGLGVLCAFLMIQQVPSRVIILTIALALGLVTLAAFLRANPAITATTAGILLRMLMLRAGIVEDESLPGALFWDLLDMIWSCIAVVILTLLALSTRFTLASVANLVREQGVGPPAHLADGSCRAWATSLRGRAAGRS